MNRSAIKTRLPWEDRWTTPSLRQLVHDCEEQRRKVVETLIEQLSGFEGVSQTLLWYGAAWKWTLQFDLQTSSSKQPIILAYLVPKPEAPLLCIPLSKEIIEQLPIRRLNKTVRDGIRSAKCAVEIHWAIWTPSAMTEVEAMVDLIKRKHKLLTAGPKAPSNGSNGQAKKS
jgi:hypothetical protein